MISFRARPSEGIDWDSVSFAGDNEELLAHLFREMLEAAEWELLTARDGGDYSSLEFEDD